MTVWWAKPTLDDIAAQRAMIERGEEKRKADWKLAERERLRDTFAAAALSGILTKDDAAQLEKMAPWWPEWACSAAYRWADAMLRERGRHHIPGVGKMVENTTNHDAAPEAKATKDGRTPKDADGTGNTPSEAEIDALECVVEEGRIASMDDYGILRSWLIRLRPEWEHQSYEESDENRTNTNTNRDTTPSEDSVQGEFTDTVFKTLVERISLTQSLLDENERLREAIRCPAAQDATLSVQGGNVTVTMDAALTDEEREAIEWYAGYGRDGLHADTLRSLIERLHT